MKFSQFEDVEYFICNRGGFNLSEALRHWKAKFETFKHFKKAVITHPGLEDFGTFVEEVWDTIDPVTVAEALQEKNIEKRRVMFDCIGTSKLFNELNPELLDKQIIQKTRTRWKENNEPYQYEFEDTYQLYKIPGEKLFSGLGGIYVNPDPVYAVRCWCTTTNREYWIYVPEQAALGIHSWDVEHQKPDAVRAIAWTIRIDVSFPERIYRQGDIIIVVESPTSKTVEPYHLNKEQYLRLMYSET